MIRKAPRGPGHRLLTLAALMLTAACANAPTPEPDSTVVWGYVRLVPRTGTDALGGGYGDRRLADARRFDYSHTRYAVVFASASMSPSTTPAALVIRDGTRTPRLDPPYTSTTPDAGLHITNATSSDRIVSVPNAGRLERLAPGGSVRMTGLPPGESSVHMLGLAAAEPPEPTLVWVAEGLTAEVEASGRFTLRGLEPGPHTLRAWHPRLPPSPAHEVVLQRGKVHRVDIQIGPDAQNPSREAVQ